MRISTFFYTLIQGIINIFRNKWFSLASVATISACLFLFGLFYAVIANFQSIVKTAEEGVSVTIFFQPGTTEEQMKEIGDKIEAREEVSKVEFTSADEAWDYYRANWIPEEFSDGSPNSIVMPAGIKAASRSGVNLAVRGFISPRTPKMIPIIRSLYVLLISRNSFFTKAAYALIPPPP